MYVIYFYDKNDRIIRIQNFGIVDKEFAIENFNSAIDKYCSGLFVSFINGKRVKKIELCKDGSTVTEVEL